MLAQRSLDSRQQTAELAQLRMEVGLTSSVDYHQSQVLVTQAQTQLAQLQRNREQAMHLLRVAGWPAAARSATAGHAARR